MYLYKIPVGQFVCGLPYSMSCHCLIVICFMSFAICYVIINCFMFFIRFIFVSLQYVFSFFYFMCSVYLYCFVHCFFPCTVLLNLYLCTFLPSTSTGWKNHLLLIDIISYFITFQITTIFHTISQVSLHTMYRYKLVLYSDYVTCKKTFSSFSLYFNTEILTQP